MLSSLFFFFFFFFAKYTNFSFDGISVISCPVLNTALQVHSRLWVHVITSTHNIWFEQKYEKYKNFLSENFPFLVVKFKIYLNKRVFLMVHCLVVFFFFFFFFFFFAKYTNFSFDGISVISCPVLNTALQVHSAR